MTLAELADAVRLRADLAVIGEAGDTLTVARPHDAPYQYQAIALTDDGEPYWKWSRKSAEDAPPTWVLGRRIDGVTSDEVAAAIAEIMTLSDRRAN